MSRILIVDDDVETCRFIQELVGEPGRAMVAVHNPDEAVGRLRHEPFDLLIADINLNAVHSGMDLLHAFKAEYPAGQVILISGFGTLETAIAAVRAGAFDYVSKPFNISEVRSTVDRALQHAAAQTADDELAAKPAPAPAGLFGHTAPMLEVYKQIAYAADSLAPALIVGESGTGKELVARAIHRHSAHSHEPFVGINCGALTETLLESELFGHTRGSFTGAVADKKGIFEHARNGTVLLDEIGEAPAALQVKLLRVLEEGEVRPVGAVRDVRVHARVIGATNADLEGDITAGRFRQDLYYRLGVIVIRLPALRERRADIPLLIGNFLEQASSRAGRKITVSSAAQDALISYGWPGNVRELQNTIERLVLYCRGGSIDVTDLPPSMRGGGRTLEESLFTDVPTLDQLERRYLIHVLQVVANNRTRAAEVLGIDRRTLYRMAERYGVNLNGEPHE
jgi:DNA-binding NtrC family response regulator